MKNICTLYYAIVSFDGVDLNDVKYNFDQYRQVYM